MSVRIIMSQNDTNESKISCQSTLYAFVITNFLNDLNGVLSNLNSTNTHSYSKEIYPKDSCLIKIYIRLLFTNLQLYRTTSSIKNHWNTSLNIHITTVAYATGVG